MLVTCAACAGAVDPLPLAETTFITDDPQRTAGPRDQGNALGETPAVIGTACERSERVEIVDLPERTTGWDPVLAYSDGRVAVAWQHWDDGSAAGFAMLDSAGHIIVPAMLLSSQRTVAGGSRVRVAGISGGFAVVWGDEREGSGHRQLFLATVDLDGTQQMERAVSDSSAVSEPVLARRTYVAPNTAPFAELALVWVDSSHYQVSTTSESGQEHLYFKTLTLDGADKRPERRIMFESSDRRIEMPRLAFDGDRYVVAFRSVNNNWERQALQRFAVLDPEGQPQWQPETLDEVADGFTEPMSLVWTGEGYALTYAGGRRHNGQLQFTQLNQYGTRISERALAASGENPCAPALAFNGENYGVAWVENCHRKGTRFVFSLLSADGRPLTRDGSICPGSAPCAALEISASDPDEAHQYPDIIAAEGKFFVAWFEREHQRVFASQVTCRPGS